MTKHQPTTLAKFDDQSKSYRYERKFVLDQQSYHDLILKVSLHPVHFRRSYPARVVNNLYFDTIGRCSYFDNVEGVAERTKMRVRWYGDMLGSIPAPFLEYKIKKGLVGTKRRYHLPTMQLSATGLGATVANVLRSASVPPPVQLDLPHVEPVLLNQYRREYFESGDQFRLTVDTQLRSFDPTQTIQDHFRNEDRTVVEIKYGPQHESAARQLLEHFGLRVMKNSKFVTGYDQL